MGNAHVISNRAGVRVNRDAPIQFREEAEPVFESHEGVQPAELVVQMKIDKV